MRICTIVATNYLAYARILAESFIEHHPDGECVVLVIDDVDGLVEDADEPFTVLRPEALALDRFGGMAAMYDVTELATAVKPWLLEHLLATGDGSPIAYFDPDIRFYAPVSTIEELALEYELVLTPHITAPIPADGKQPGELDLLASGTYNLGFVAVAPGDQVGALLAWWQDRLRYDCVIDHALGYFVDQRWFDLVPGWFPGLYLLRDVTMNVAYWNLHEREVLEGADGSWSVDGKPLRFFHFSGFNPDHPHLLSKHQTRTRLGEHPSLAKLCAAYAEEVRAHRRPSEAAVPYGWRSLGNGRLWDRRLRRLYRIGERAGAFRLDPFTEEGAAEFFDWLNESAPELPDGNPISRFWLEIYLERVDLRVAFPDLNTDPYGYLDWINVNGRQAGDVRGLVAEDAQASGRSELSPTRDVDVPRSRQPTLSPRTAVPWGVNVAGFLQSELGTGEAARAVIAALDAAQVPVQPVHGPWRPSSRQGHDYAFRSTQDAVFPVNIVCVNADVLDRWVTEAGPDFFAGRYTVGFWWWEVSTFPTEWMHAFDLVDEIWVATQHVADALTPISGVPVHKVTMPVSLAAPPPRSRRELGLPDGFVFLYLFDHHSIFERKNPLAVIEAFKLAFPAGGSAQLVIKSINHEHHPDAHDRLRLAAGQHPSIHLLEHYVSAAEKNAMIASADCYVSLHRAEGFGLGPAEAMYLGKPVIATRYGGNLEYMTERNSWLIDYELVPIGAGNTPYPATGEWADPDVTHAARAMREVSDDPGEARRRGAQAARDLRSGFSPEAAGRTMTRRLESIHARRGRWPAQVSTLPVANQPDFTRLEVLLEAGPRRISRSSLGRVAALARRTLLRVIKPFSAYERMVDEAVLAQLRTLAANTARLEQARVRDAEFNAQLLRELRRRPAPVTDSAEELDEPPPEATSNGSPAENPLDLQARAAEVSPPLDPARAIYPSSAPSDVRAGSRPPRSASGQRPTR